MGQHLSRCPGIDGTGCTSLIDPLPRSVRPLPPRPAGRTFTDRNTS